MHIYILSIQRQDGRLAYIRFTASMASFERSHSSASMVICQHRGLPFMCSAA